MMKNLRIFRYQGFAMLSLTLMLLLVTFSISVPAAFSEYKRIQRVNLALLHQQSKVKAAMKLDLLYLALYESPMLLNLANACAKEGVVALALPETIIAKYQLFEPVYLCQNSASHFVITIHLDLDIGITDVIATRQLLYLDDELSWINDSFIDF